MNSIDFTKLKVASYNRKSSESEDRQVLSIDAQINEANRIADYYKLPPFASSFQESKSAKKANNRPEFTRMMQMVSENKIDAFVCWKLDRLARNMTEGGNIIDLLSSGIIKAIITHDKVYYPWDNVMVMAVEFGQTSQFVKDLSVNVKRGQKYKAEKGVPHGVASLGFVNDKTEEKGNRKWLVDEGRLGKIKVLLDLFLTGNFSAGKLHRYAVEELKLTTVQRKRIGGAFIVPSRIFEILKDPVFQYIQDSFSMEGNAMSLIKAYLALLQKMSIIKSKQFYQKAISQKSSHMILFSRVFWFQMREILLDKMLSFNLFVIVNTSLHIEIKLIVLNVELKSKSLNILNIFHMSTTTM